MLLLPTKPATIYTNLVKLDDSQIKGLFLHDMQALLYSSHLQSVPIFVCTNIGCIFVLLDAGVALFKDGEKPKTLPAAWLLGSVIMLTPPLHTCVSDQVHILFTEELN